MAPKKSDDDKLLDEIRDTIASDTDAWEDTKREGNLDMRCIGGDPWGALDPKGLQQRQDAMRPALALDELGQYLNQAVNDWLLNPRAIEFDPVGNGANDKTAQFYADKTRAIEFDSHAQNAYATCYRDGLQRSYGWVRVRTARESSRSFNQKLMIDAIPNPDMIIPDADAQLPDQSDMTHLTCAREYRHAEFKRRFPKAKIKTFSRAYQELFGDWLSDDKIQVAEHWRIQMRPRRLLLLPDGTTLFQDELDDLLAAKKIAKAPPIEDAEDVDDPYVVSILTNGLEILERTDWPGRHIPFASCFGKILFFDGGAGVRRTLLSMTRLARDPYMLYCYYRSCEAELVGMTPKFPYFVYEGQLSPKQLRNLEASLHQPIAVIQVKPTIDGMPQAQALGFPQRQPYEPPLGPLELGAEAARRAIQAAMGISPLPTPAQRNNEKSGQAFQRIESSMQKGSFHFIDHGEYMVRQTGVILEDLIEKIYDTPRETGLISAIGKASRVTINVPGGIWQTKGDHLVTVKAGPAYESSRDATSDFITGLVKAPALAQMIGAQKFAALLAMSIRMMNLGPLGDQLAGLIDQQSGQNNPMALAQENAGLKAQIKQVGDALQKAMTELNTDAVKARGRITEKQIDAQNAITLQRMKDATTLAVKKIDALTKGVIADNESEDEIIALASEQVHELRMAEQEHLHGATDAAHTRRHEIVRAIQDHLHTLEQAGQEHHHNLQALAANALVSGHDSGSGGASN